MKKIVIFGAGGMGREVAWLIENINTVNPTWELLGFLDDDPKYEGEDLNGYCYLGNKSWIENYKDEIYLTIGIGKSTVRNIIFKYFKQFFNVKFASLIDPSVRIGKSVLIREGCIICRNSVLTVNTLIEAGVILNIGASIGHDCIIGEFCTFSPYSCVGGGAIIGENCEVGTSAFIFQGKTIASNTLVAPLSSVLKDIEEPGTYIGNPARRMI